MIRSLWEVLGWFFHEDTPPPGDPNYVSSWNARIGIGVLSVIPLWIAFVYLFG
ncbi:MAG: hypothetical protein R3B13_29400 [Polyangiaceae bacterium]